MILSTYIGEQLLHFFFVYKNNNILVTNMSTRCEFEMIRFVITLFLGERVELMERCYCLA